MLHGDKLKEVQAPTQFQNEESSYELAWITLTETISYGLHIKKTPVFALFSDFQSAYDKVLVQSAVKAAFLAGTTD